MVSSILSKKICHEVEVHLWKYTEYKCVIHNVVHFPPYYVACWSWIICAANWWRKGRRTSVKFIQEWQQYFKFREFIENSFYVSFWESLKLDVSFWQYSYQKIYSYLNMRWVDRLLYSTTIQYRISTWHKVSPQHNCVNWGHMNDLHKYP